MESTITITLPDEMLELIRADAEKRNQSVEQVILDKLSSNNSPHRAHPRRAEMRREAEAFAAQHPQLVQSYLGAYIAMRHGQVVDHDTDSASLLRRVRQNYQDQTVLIEKVNATYSDTIHTRSPRLA